MKVLVSGAGGFLGRHLVDRLLAGGHTVRAIIRPASPQPAWDKSVEIARADLRSQTELGPLFEGIDAVIHVAAATSGDEDAQFASTVVATENFLNAMAKSSVRRLIHVSSLVVYDWSQARSVMDEMTPLRTNMYAMGGYTIAKIWQERVVRKAANDHGWDLSVMRPGFIWGPQHSELAGMGRRLGKVYIMFGPFTRLPLSHVVNCADCLVAALERPQAVGETFNVIDADDVRVLRYVREYARRTGQRGLFVPVPYSLGLATAHLAAVTSRLLFGNNGKLPSLLMPRRFESQFKPIRFSNQKLLARLNWTPPKSFLECLELTYAPSQSN